MRSNWRKWVRELECHLVFPFIITNPKFPRIKCVHHETWTWIFTLNMTDFFFGHFGTKIQILWILLIIDWTNTPVIRNSSNSQNGIQKSQISVRKANSVPDMILLKERKNPWDMVSQETIFRFFFFFTFFQTSNKSF